MEGSLEVMRGRAEQLPMVECLVWEVSCRTLTWELPRSKYSSLAFRSTLLSLQDVILLEILNIQRVSEWAWELKVYEKKANEGNCSH